MIAVIHLATMQKVHKTWGSHVMTYLTTTFLVIEVSVPAVVICQGLPLCPKEGEVIHYP